MEDRDIRCCGDPVERLAMVAAAYGADPLRWPSAERAALKEVLADMDAAAEQLDEERALDRLLDLMPPAEPPPGSVGRVLVAAGIRPAGGDVVPFRRAGPVAPVGLRLGPAIGVIAASLMLGLYTGSSHVVDPLFDDNPADQPALVDDLDTALIDPVAEFDFDDEFGL